MFYNSFADLYFNKMKINSCQEKIPFFIYHITLHVVKVALFPHSFHFSISRTVAQKPRVQLANSSQPTRVISASHMEAKNVERRSKVASTRNASDVYVRDLLSERSAKP